MALETIGLLGLVCVRNGIVSHARDDAETRRFTANTGRFARCRGSINDDRLVVAEEGRFELPETVRPHWFSKPAHSTALAPLRFVGLVERGSLNPLSTRREKVIGHTIGHSEEGRAIIAFELGDGPRRASLLGGAHADEPIGPRTLRGLDCAPDGWSFFVVPDVNPDGAERNRGWFDQWPDIDAYRAGRLREPPGRDVEFGYPAMRPENAAVAAYLSEHDPFDLHMSFHGMGEAPGALLLIDKRWIDRTEDLRTKYATALTDAGLPLMDVDRGGEKGFTYIAPGFWTTPESSAMRAFFEERGDPKTAATFHLNSMEFVRSLGGDPLCLVTEIPLFVDGNPVSLETAGALQLRALELAVGLVS